MHVASLELCRTLWKLSGWENNQWHDTPFKKSKDGLRTWRKLVPAYDLGYLLRKLPEFTRLWLNGEVDYWVIFTEGDKYGAKADTPEDAAAKLCIELFKSGVLKR